MANHMSLVWKDTRSRAWAYSADTMSAEVIEKLLEEVVVAPATVDLLLGDEGGVDDEDEWRADEFPG